MEIDKDKFDTLVKDVGEIKTALLGMPSHDIEGIVSKVKKHEKYIERSKLRLGFWTGISTGFGYILHQTIDFFSKH